MECLMDWQTNPMMYGWKGNFPGYGLSRIFVPGILVGIFILNIADGWMDFQVEYQLD